MEKILKKLIFWYLIFVIIKSILSYFVPSPSAFSDEYIYAKMSREFFINLDFIDYKRYPPLYPILLSISYLFNDMNLVYMTMKFINAVLSSLIIFPAWLISKEFMNKKNALEMAILVSLIPPIFAFSPILMSENFFFTIFLFSSYFLYKSFTSQKYKWDILAGISISLTILTRTMGIILIPSLLLFWIIDIFRKDHLKQLKKKLILFSFLIIIFLPLIIKNISSYGFTFSSILGRYSTEATSSLSTTYPFERIIPRFFIYLGYIIISSLAIFSIAFLSIFKSIKNNRNLFVLMILSMSMILFSLLAVINHGIFAQSFTFPWLGGRVLERYVATIFPLIFILGGIGLIKKQEISPKIIFIISLILIFSLNLLAIALFPVNNMSLTYIGVINAILENLIPASLTLIIFGFIFSLLPFIANKIYQKMNFEKILTLTILFFVILGGLNYLVISFNSYTYWYQGDQMQLGIWFNDYDNGESIVLFDIRDTGEKIWKENQNVLCDPNACIMGFWMNDNILIGNPDEIKADYVISKHKLDFPIVKEQGGIYIYESNNNDPGI